MLERLKKTPGILSRSWCGVRLHLVSETSRPERERASPGRRERREIQERSEGPVHQQEAHVRVRRVNAPGVLLDTGPIVALLSGHDAEHERATRLFAGCLPPFRCCEAVLAEACFLIRKVDSAGPAEVVRLARRGVFETSFILREHWADIEALLKKYEDRPISLADACLIRCAEVHQEARILTFDRDFSVYRWSRTRRFEILGQ